MASVESTNSVSNNSASEVSKANEVSAKTENKSSVVSEPLSAENSSAGTMSKVGELGTSGEAMKARLNGSLNKTEAAAPPDLTTEASVTRTGGKTIIDAGAGDDRIAITEDAKTGAVTVNVNGAESVFKGSDRDNLVIRAGEGNDNIAVGENVTVKLTLEGQDGDDRITVSDKVSTGQVIEGGAGRDTIIGGGGMDYINGSTGDDFIMGRGGNDVIYAGDGDDYVSGGDGDDYLEGGKGNDTVRGWNGNDNISGGQGDDSLSGGDGNDVLYAGEGKDKIYGQTGDNKVFSQTADTVDANSATVTNTVVEIDMTDAIGSSVVINGSDEFKQRIEQDLDMLRSSPVGREMLAAWDNTGHTVTINEFDQQNGTARPTNGINTSFDTANQKPGRTDDATFNINPDFYPADHIPPIVVFYHEGAHALDYMQGTLRTDIYGGNDGGDHGIKDAERVAVGLPIDHDKDPSTPEIVAPEHPQNLTENALRDELNRQLRPRYRAF